MEKTLWDDELVVRKGNMFFFLLMGVYPNSWMVYIRNIQI